MDNFLQNASVRCSLAACSLLLAVGCQENSGTQSASMKPPGLLRVDADAHALAIAESHHAAKSGAVRLTESHEVVRLPVCSEPATTAQEKTDHALLSRLGSHAPRPLPPIVDILPEDHSFVVGPGPKVDSQQADQGFPRARFRSETRPLPPVAQDDAAQDSSVTPQDSQVQEIEGPSLGSVPEVEQRQIVENAVPTVDTSVSLPPVENRSWPSMSAEQTIDLPVPPVAQKRKLSSDPAMQAVAREAANHVRTGFVLANRGAFFSARSEFIRALRIISQALDSGTGESQHSTALAAGIRALSEAEDFVPRGTRLEADMDVASLLPAHRTPVMKFASQGEMTTLNARRKYYTYAQEQLALAAGSERAGSMALYGLARVQMSLSARNPDRYTTSAPRAMTLHQAALLVDQDNYMAANELGVMLARYGQYSHARALLTRSLSVAPQAVTWNNLAVVHQRLGEADLAQKAKLQAASLQRAERQAHATRSASPKDVVWTDAAAFSRKNVASGNKAGGRK